MREKDRGVIAKFKDGKYSFKTKGQCMWCRGRYFESEQEIKRQFPKVYFSKEVVSRLDYYSPEIFNERIDELLNKISN